MPLSFTGLYSVINPDVAGGASEAVAVVSVGQGANGTRFLSDCYNFSTEFTEFLGDSNCGTGNYSFGFLAASNSPVGVYLEAGLVHFGTDVNAGLISAFIDPFIQIDPLWLSANPGYSLTFDAGVGNATVSAVPEPATTALLLFGAGVLGLRRRFQRGHAAS